MKPLALGLVLLLLLTACSATPSATPAPTPIATATPPAATATPTLASSPVRPEIAILTPQAEQPADIIWQVCEGSISTQSGEYVYQMHYPQQWLMDYEPLTSNCGMLYSALDEEGALPPGGIQVQVTVLDCATSPECFASGRVVRTEFWSGMSAAFYDSLFGLSTYVITIPVDEKALRIAFMVSELPTKITPDTFKLLSYMLYTLSINQE